MTARKERGVRFHVSAEGKGRARGEERLKTS